MAQQYQTPGGGDLSPDAVGVFGGTFDPIHYGHLRIAHELHEALGLEAVAFLPAGTPPHRDSALADAATRLAVVEAAIAGDVRFHADDRELRRAGPSYTILTLEELRAERGDQPLVLILGMDAFAGLDRWHRAGELASLAHIVVAHRPGWQAPTSGTLGELLRERRAASVADLAARPAGLVHVQPVTQLEISSTDLRDSLRAGRDPKFLVPDAVREIILETECYAESL